MSATMRSLSFVIAAGLVAALSLSMAVYAGFQYLLNPELTVRELLFQHLLHMLALSPVIYLFSWFAVDRLLVQPIHQIYLHLYEIRKGKQKPLMIQTRVRELQTIVDAVNILILRRSEEKNE